MQILHVKKNLELIVGQRSEEILIGCILGDAYITKKGQIRIEHGPKQKEYLLWKYNELKSLAYQRICEAERKDKRSGKMYKSFYITLRQYFRSWHNIWYRDNKKVFPQDIPITNLSLAVWYMDDGYWDRKAVFLSIDGFSKTDRRKIQQFFRDQLKIESTINIRGKLRIRKRSEENFIERIKPYIVSCMRYKIPNPVTTDS